MHAQTVNQVDDLEARRHPNNRKLVNLHQNTRSEIVRQTFSEYLNLEISGAFKTGDLHKV